MVVCDIKPYQQKKKYRAKQKRASRWRGIAREKAGGIRKVSMAAAWRHRDIFACY